MSAKGIMSVVIIGIFVAFGLSRMFSGQNASTPAGSVAVTTPGASPTQAPEQDSQYGTGEGLVNLDSTRLKREPPKINIGTLLSEEERAKKKDEGGWGFVKNNIPIVGPIAKAVEFVWKVTTNPFLLIPALFILFLMSPIVGGVWWGFGRVFRAIWDAAKFLWGAGKGQSAKNGDSGSSQASPSQNRRGANRRRR